MNYPLLIYLIMILLELGFKKVYMNLMSIKGEKALTNTD